ncbi:MAG: Stk1 family PASTA domain-containing Ser/Thr kinase [Clostridiales bacterium]|nr:Stk1 family PASTA domain-containing Ser/Thr kinase [Clostridiales bacterium]
MTQIIGSILSNRYEIMEVLGTGGMATVYKGKDLILNRMVAVKILKTEFNSDEEFVNKFKKESQAAAKLSHPNIVNIFDVGFSDDHHYIVMELVSGNTLKDYLVHMQGFMREEAIINIVMQVASALTEAHHKDIIHRDIKSQNILVSENGSIKVADFGIARAATTSTLVNTKEIIGSVHYASPEQARGGYVDARSDIYSLGIMMYELATKELPFEGDTPVTVALKQIKDELPNPQEVNRSISEGLASIIKKATEKNPTDRYQDMVAFIDDLKMLKSDKDFLANSYNHINQETAVLPKITEDQLMRYKTTKVADKKNNQVPDGHKPTRLNITLVVLAALVMAIMVFGIFALNQFKNIFDVDLVPVPGVVGMPVDEAVRAMTDVGLLADVTERRFNDDVEVDHIISQSYPEGEELKEGFTVKLVVSNGGIQSLIPNVKQQTLSKARVMIEVEGFEVGEITYEFNDFPEDMIIDQTPKSGIKMDEGTVIDLVVSRGPEVKTFIVPSVIGMTIREAEVTLNQLGLKLGSISYELNDGTEKGRIITQEFLGTEVNQGTEIPVIVSNGPETIIEDPVEPEEPVGTESELRLTIHLELEKFSGDTETIRIEMLQNGVSEVIYENVHSKSEGPDIAIQKTITGSGTATISVFYGSVKGYEQEIEF